MKRSRLIGFLLAVVAQLTAVFAYSTSVSSIFLLPRFADQSSICPVTLRPVKAFVPPFPYLNRPPDPVSFWYGTKELWTQVFAPPPWTPWKAQQKVRMYWASENKSNDERPELSVEIKRIGENQPAITIAAPDTVSYTPKRFGMIAEVTFPTAGCWQVTGQYRGKSLKYVVRIEQEDADSTSGSNPTSADVQDSRPFVFPNSNRRRLPLPKPPPRPQAK
jgi:hypothetical protein